jgi:hypothetical protein
VSLPWVRLDTQFATNPKVLLLVEAKQHRALFVYCCALGYSGAHGTNGFIPKGALPFVHGTKRDADQLVSVGLWVPTPTGYDINDWADYQQTGQEMAARRTKAQAAAMARWHPEQFAEMKGDDRA